MLFCSEKARALCSDREHCGHDVRGDFAADSWCGGLGFDEYLPGILSDRKKLPLFLSSSFSQKRRDMFSGDWVFTSDDRLACRIDHSCRGGTDGFHGLTYKRPGAGAARVTAVVGPQPE